MFQSENGNIVKTVFLIGLYDDNVYFLFMCWSCNFKKIEILMVSHRSKMHF